MGEKSKENAASLEMIKQKVFIIRGCKVMLSTDLAELYQVETKVLIQAVKRNLVRFPDDFMFQLTWDEADSLRSQNVTLNKASQSSASRSQIVTLKRGEKLNPSRSQFVILKKGGNIKYLPYAFTEQGVAMLSSVLKSRRAVLVNIAIMRAFVMIREALAAHKELAVKLKELESKVGKHDEEIQAILEAIHRLMKEEERPKRGIGFHVR